VAKLTNRPNKRKIEPANEKVMPTGGPRQAVTRVAKSDVTPTDDADTKVDEPVAGTSARAEQLAAKKAEEAEAKNKKKRKNRRVTEKGTTPNASTRYTPPSAKFDDMPSPLWVPVLMFTLFALGMLTIFLNYVGMLPAATSNWYLLLGLGFILSGIITATQYR
jgi:hypothetical protein